MNIVTGREFLQTNPQDDPDKYPRLPPGFYWDAYEQIHREPRFDSPDLSIPVVSMGDRNVRLRRNTFFLLRFGQSAIAHSEFIVSRGLKKIGVLEEPMTDREMQPGGTRRLHWLIYVKPSKASTRTKEDYASIVEHVSTPNGGDRNNMLIVELLPEADRRNDDGAKQRRRYPTIRWLATGFFQGTRDDFSIVRRNNRFLLIDGMRDTEQVWQDEKAAEKLWEIADEYVRDGSFHLYGDQDRPPGGDRGIVRILYDDGKYAADPEHVPLLAALIKQLD